ncbi:hypothetical protein EST38_g69 [Candolleomyces aberdarensis]|uniref:Uncharacterized protein n=1 Tax=Candolleomyces aberdarensis TaxID=2316362 RepID=A0A4Q2E381_9AGAR|nr:hypothetical protein EST38_g69 [Candolleomyces aberdarensis]
MPKRRAFNIATAGLISSTLDLDAPSTEMPITPDDLVQEWEKAGLIDKLRQELMAKYKDSEEYQKFASQIREATSLTFSEAVIGSLPLPELTEHMSQEAIRDSLLENTIQNSGVLSDPALESNVRPALERILRRKKMAELRAAQGQDNSDGTPAHMTPSVIENATPQQATPLDANEPLPSDSPKREGCEMDVDAAPQS